MLSHLTLHHPPLFLLKLNLTSFISTLHHPHTASPENQPDTLPFRFIRRSIAGSMSIPLFGEPLQTELPQRTLLLIARFGFSVMLIYTLFIFTTARFTPLILKLSPTSFISMLHHPHAASPENQPDTLPFRFIRRSIAGSMSIPLFGEPLQTELPQRTLLLIARFGFSVMLIYTLFIFTTARFTPLIFMLFIFTLHHRMLFLRKLFILTPLIFTLHRLMLHHRKLFILTSFRLTPLRRQLLRPFSSYPAPQHRNQFSIAFPNPRKTNLFHSQIIQFLHPVPLN